MMTQVYIAYNQRWGHGGDAPSAKHLSTVTTPHPIWVRAIRPPPHTHGAMAASAMYVNTSHTPRGMYGMFMTLYSVLSDLVLIILKVLQSEPDSKTT